MPAAVASDWVVDAASDIKTFRNSPHLRVARIRLQSGAGTLPTGANPTIPLPPNSRLGLRNNPVMVKVINGITMPSGLTETQNWEYHPGAGGFKMYRRNATVSLTTDLNLIQPTASWQISGAVLYIEVTGR